MKTKHTPGPWSIDDNAVVLKDWQDRFSEMDDPDEATICRMANIRGQDFPNSVANARLIAAAPALYEALKAIAGTAYLQCLGGCESIDGNNKKGKKYGICDCGAAQIEAQARAALRLAEGGGK